eukprot:3493146-Rhodomonas_salina.2
MGDRGGHAPSRTICLASSNDILRPCAQTRDAKEIGGAEATGASEPEHEWTGQAWTRPGVRVEDVGWKEGGSV